MKTMHNYLKKYGNTSFEELPFNEVDSLILCELSYYNFDMVCPQTGKWDNKIFSYDWVFNLDTVVPLAKDTMTPVKQLKLLQLFVGAERYKCMKIGHIVNQLDYDEVIQFYAITFIFPNFTYICYRGTDITMLGWRENLNMAIMEEIPAQKLALDYLNTIGDLHDTTLYVGGHSKGGNLAMYASMYCQKNVKERIAKVYDFDGPGFNYDPYNDPEFKEIEDRVEKYSTKSALVGLLLNYYDDITYINCKSISILQHDPLNWCVTKTGHLSKTKNTTLSSKIFTGAVRNFLLETSETERTEFISLLFKIIDNNPYTKVTELIFTPLHTIRNMFVHYYNLEPEEQKRFKYLGKRFTKYLFHPKKEKRIALTKQAKFNKMLAKQERMSESF